MAEQVLSGTQIVTEASAIIGVRNRAESPRLLAPREHGAWAMLLLPFVSALLLAGRLSWDVAPMVVAAVGAFVIREPLVVLWRQARIWRERRPESDRARRSLAWYAPAIAASGAALVWRLPFAPLAALASTAGALTAVSIYLAVQNRGRSVLLQLASAAGLTASAPAAWLSTGAPWDSRIWWLWGLQFAHSAAALLAVHARLEARVAARANTAAAARMRPRAIAAQAALTALALACVLAGRPGLAVAPALSATVHALDLANLSEPAFLRVPLRRVGLRELAISAVFSAALLWALW